MVNISRSNFDILAASGKMNGSDMFCWRGQHFAFVDLITYCFSLVSQDKDNCSS